ncbi:MAG TPA: aspartate kinase [Bacteroidales bacterium]|nr:aspartate kinase [Bacteroidales bacterium]
MITISQAVETILANKPFILDAMNDNIINYSLLANFIKPDVEVLLKKEVKDSAIVMAIRRFKSVNDVGLIKRIENQVKHFGDILVRSNLVDYTFKNSETLLQNQQRLLDKIKDKKGFFYTVTQGVYETTFILSDQVKDEIHLIFEGEKLISSCYNLSSVTIKLPTGNTEQPGLYYYIFKKLAWDGINILEVVSTSNEFTILLKDKDIDKAFSVIKNLKS